MEYSLTVDTIKKLSLSWNQVGSALDGWTSMNKLAIMLVNAYYMDQHCVLWEQQQSFNEVDRLFCSIFER